MHKQQIIIYPADSADGLGAVWAAWEFYGQGAYYLPYRYNDPVPAFERDAEVFVLGCGIALNLIATAAINATRIVVIENQLPYEIKYHAFTRTQNPPPNVTFIFDQNHSNCVLAWNYFNQGQPVPLLLEMIQDQYLSLFTIDMSREVVAALYNRMPIELFEFGGISVGELRGEGKALTEQVKRIATRMLKSRHPIMLDGVTGMAVNASPAFANDLGLMMSTEKGTFGMTYHYNGDRKLWVCSLRSNGDVDVGRIAGKFGGGGRELAAGFSVDKGKMLDLLNGIL